MFTTCDKKIQGSKYGPYVYTMDSEVSKNTKPTIFASLLGGVSKRNPSGCFVDIETQLKGQDSKGQLFCRETCTTTRIDGRPMPWFVEPPIQQACDTTALKTQVVSQQKPCCCRGKCVCNDTWLGRNVVIGKCLPARMTTKSCRH